MKRRLTAIFLLCLLLCGCDLFSRTSQEPVLFYYQRADYVLGEANGSIDAEERDGTGHITDMDYLLRLYLAGPMNEDLTSPFPADVQLTSIRTGQNMVTVTLTGSPDILPEAQKTLACACLTLTCLDMAAEENVMIFWGDEIITMDRSCLTLFDSSVQIPKE